MANIFTQMPIFIDTDTTVVGNTNWRGSSGGAQLNPGNLPTNLQQTSGAVSRQWGIRPTLIIITQAVAATITVAGDIVITDPQTTGGAGQLLKISVPATAAAGVMTPIILREEDLGNNLWRDFIVTGVTATKVALQIYYRP
jgi:hypothetical protein